MDVETYKKINREKHDRHKDYQKNIVKYLKIIDANKLSIDEVLDMLKESYNIEKNNIIEDTIELFYNNKKYKRFINKDKYKKRIKKYLYIINVIKEYLKSTYDIKNDYALYYCKYQTIEIINIYKNKKEISKILKHLIYKISVLEKKYSDITKELYRKVKNYEELKNIRAYEAIYRNSRFLEQEQGFLIMSEVGEIIKNLKLSGIK